MTYSEGSNLEGEAIDSAANVIAVVVCDCDDAQVVAAVDKHHYCVYSPSLENKK